MNSKNSVKKQKKKHKNPFRYFLYDFCRVTNVIPAFCWLRPKRLYESRAARKRVRGAAVLIANHTGFSDPISVHLAMWYRRMHCLATSDLFASENRAWFFTKMHCIPVDRDNFSMETYRACMETLADRRILCIFPEGGINTDRSKVNAFKSGSVLMALKGNAPIVPLYIAKREHWYERTVIVIGEPIDVNALCGGQPNIGTIDQVTQEIHEKEMKLMEVYKTWKAKKSSR